MKRDMDLIRDVLLFMENSKDFNFFHQEIAEGLGRDFDSVVAHVVMLRSGGYLEERQTSVFRMTWAGHELLDAIRDPEIWRKTKSGAEKVGSWSVKLIGDLATGFIRAKAIELGLPIGP